MRKHAGWIWAVVGWLMWGGATLRAGEFDFLEKFSLFGERPAALQTLAPGTDEYYLYHCLAAQHEGDLARAGQLLDKWLKERGNVTLAEQMRLRQALLQYPQQPQKTLELIVRQLNLQFDHHSAAEERAVQLPSALDPKLVDRAAFLRRALAHDPNLNGCDDSALVFLAGMNLNPTQRRELLRRLDRPDLPEVVALVVADLRDKNSGGFGSLPIHGLLTREQLDACLAQLPFLLGNEQFVGTYLARLRPSDDVDPRRDPAERERWLDRQLEFADRLPLIFNSLKANLLYHRLVHDRSLGKYDHERFHVYLRLPRRAVYANDRYVEQVFLRKTGGTGLVNLNADFAEFIGLPSIGGNDEPLVRAYLEHFLADAADPHEFAQLIEEDYLRQVFAEIKLLTGQGNPEQWAAQVGPDAYRRLRDRVELRFVAENPEKFAIDDPVHLALEVKNVPRLLARVYELNAFNYYREKSVEIQSDIDLDGLVPGSEVRQDYAEPPVRRVRREFDFPELKGRAGVFVVEFVGGGLMSRAVVRKGGLRLCQRRGAAGHVFTAYDDSGQPRPDAALWLGAREFKADADGEMTVPYSTAPGQVKAVVKAGDLCALLEFEHLAETYRLEAGFFVERESLLKGRRAQLLVRPRLSVAGLDAPLKLLEHVRLVLTAVDREGVVSRSFRDDPELDAKGELIHEFAVPENLAQLNVRLEGKVKNLSQGNPESLAVERSFAVNGIDATERTAALLFAREGGEYRLWLLGKNGEPRAGKKIHLTFDNRYFTDNINLVLQTDAAGLIRLGTLPEIKTVAAQGDGTTAALALPDDRAIWPAAIHVRAGEEIVLPDPSAGADRAGISRAEASLLELRDAAIVRDCFAALERREGGLAVKGLEPGSYRLTLPEAGARIMIRVTAGVESAGRLLGARAILEKTPKPALRVAELAADQKELTIRLANASPAARVHVLATRFIPEFDAFAQMNEPGRNGLWSAEPGWEDSVYVSERAVGDECRYILDRQRAQKYPGVMLERPSLLLNPWSVSRTQTDRALAKADQAWAAKRRGVGSRVGETMGGGNIAQACVAADNPLENLDFLAESAVVLTNLRPDAEGRIKLDLRQFAGHQQIRVVALDLDGLVQRDFSLPGEAVRTRDVRQPARLDLAKHYLQQRRIELLAAGGEVKFADAATADYRVYDQLAKVWRLYSALCSDSELSEFAFLAGWPKLSAQEKREKYSLYCCHELNFFLHEKDPEFFAAVVKPYLANKKEKQFFDHWLLDEDLTPYLETAAFQRLNAAEQALLARRRPEARERIVGSLRDRVDLLPPDPERDRHLFETALQCGEMDNVASKPSEEEKNEIVVSTESVGASGGRYGSSRRTAVRRGGGAAGQANFGVAAEVMEDAKENKTKGMPRQEALAAAAVPAAPPAAAPAKAMRMLDELADKDLAAREKQREFYRAPEKTEEYVENQYYQRPRGEQGAGLITAARFWLDYAAHGEGAFLSPALAEACRNRHEALLALGALGLPFAAPEPVVAVAEGGLTCRVAGPAEVYRREIRETPAPAERSPVLVAQNCFRADDRYRYEDNRQVDKFVAGEFLTQVVYGCRVAVTNPTSAPQSLELLLQIPAGALPVQNGFFTSGRQLELSAYATQTVEYYFYFPAPGEAAFYPVQVGRSNGLAAWADPRRLTVNDQPTTEDKTSWNYLSQRASLPELLAALAKENLGRVELNQLAWRLREPEAYRAILGALEARGMYDDTLWSYALKHNDVPRIRQFLAVRANTAELVGPWLDSALLTIDPVDLGFEQHREYLPLVNARAHRFADHEPIRNDRFRQRWGDFLRLLAYKPQLDNGDRLGATYYLLLQDRLAEALAIFARLDAAKPVEQVQYDYLRAYLAFAQGQPAEAAKITAAYAAYPVPRWQKRFAEVNAQAAEIAGGQAQREKPDLAAGEAALELVEAQGGLVVDYQNLATLTVNLYPLDLELLFSRQPFLRDAAAGFSYVKPAQTLNVMLEQRSGRLPLALPEKWKQTNLIVEASAGGVSRSRVYTAHHLAPRLIEAYGQVQVNQSDTGPPAAGAYVKVYARLQDGSVEFYKDGYADLRGRFDYVSLSTDQLARVERFALLIQTETHGAVVLEAMPPKQ